MFFFKQISVVRFKENRSENYHGMSVTKENSVKRLVTRQRYKRPPKGLSTLGPREPLVPGSRHKMLLRSHLPKLQLCT